MALEVGTNSWITVADADDYFSSRYGASKYWTAELAIADKEAVLITAYKQLNNCGFFSFPSEAIDVMKDAQCEQALFLLIHMEDIDRRKGLQAQGVKSANIVGETYRDDMMEKMPIAPIVKDFLAEYSTEGDHIYAVDLERDEEEDVV